MHFQQTCNVHHSQVMFAHQSRQANRGWGGLIKQFQCYIVRIRIRSSVLHSNQISHHTAHYLGYYGLNLNETIKMLIYRFLTYRHPFEKRSYTPGFKDVQNNFFSGLLDCHCHIFCLPVTQGSFEYALCRSIFVVKFN